MGEIDPLRPALCNGEIGDGNVDLAVRRGVDQSTDRRERAVFALYALRSRDRLPELDRHSGEPILLLHDKWRANEEPDPDRLFGLRPFLRKRLVTASRLHSNTSQRALLDMKKFLPATMPTTFALRASREGQLTPSPAQLTRMSAERRTDAVNIAW